MILEWYLSCIYEWLNKCFANVLCLVFNEVIAFQLLVSDWGITMYLPPISILWIGPYTWALLMEYALAYLMGDDILSQSILF